MANEEWEHLAVDWAKRQVEKLQTMIALNTKQTDDALSVLNERIEQVESRLNAYGVPMVRGEYPDVVSSLRSRGPRYDRWKGAFGETETVERGVVQYPPHEIRQAALQDAATRVREYLLAHQFSGETIQDLITAVWGQPTPPEN